MKKIRQDGFKIETVINYMEPAFKAAGYRENSSDNEKNILIVRLDLIGDNVMTSGFIRELRKNFLNAHITLIVMPNVVDLMKYCPYIDEVIGFSVTHIQNISERFIEILELCANSLWGRKYDMAFLPRWDEDLPSFAGFIAYFSGAKERIGYSPCVYKERMEKEGFLDALLTFPVISPPNVVHEVARGFYLLATMGLSVENSSLEVWYADEDYKRIKEKVLPFAKGRKIIAVVPGAGASVKVYPKEKLAAALNEIKREGNCFMILGGKKEKRLCDLIEARLDENAALNLAGETSLREMAAALAISSMYIGMDTGAKHIAAALHLPTIEISCAPLSLEPSPLLYADRFAPWQTPTIIVRPKQALPPCDKIEPFWGCTGHTEAHCITQIKPEEIVGAYEKLSAIQFYDYKQKI